MNTVRERTRPVYSRRFMVKTALAVLLAVGLLAALAVIQILQDGQRRALHQERLEQSVLERTHVRRLFSSLQDAESAQRGYIVTGNEALLTRYERAAERLPGELDDLLALVSEEPRREQAEELEEHVLLRLDDLAAGIEARHRHGFAAAFDLMGTGGGHDAMEAIRRLVDAMVDSETQAIDGLQTAARGQASAFQIMAISLLGGILMLVLAASLLGIGYLESRRRAEQTLHNAKLEAQRAQSQAEQASEAKSEFLASMSHEIRTPLSGILGYTELLLKEGLEPHQRRYVERIQGAGASLLTVVDDILNFSRIEAGEVRLEPHPFGLRALVDNIVSILATAAERKGLVIGTELDPRLPETVVGDEARLRQILLNLMNNAVKFTERGRITLTIAVERLGDDAATLRFAISDTGIGIAQDNLGRLFRRFSQADPSITQRFGGTGLGLAICKHLVDLMGGEIGVDTQEGRGSTFWFTVRLGRSETAALETHAPEHMEPGRQGRILVVEDLEQNQDLARAMLEGAGHSVDVVGGGAEAIEAVGAAVYDLVLMDVQMPEMDGLAATRAIRALPPPAGDLPIVAMTANVLPQQVKAVRAAGMNDHIGKPFRRVELLEKVARWLPEGREAAAHDEPGPREALADLRQMMGREWALKGLRRLRRQLAETFGEAGPPPDGDALAQRAHALVSLAATFGFHPLSRLCSELEDAAASGRPSAAPFAAARQAAQRAQPAIEAQIEELERCR